MSEGTSLNSILDDEPELEPVEAETAETVAEPTPEPEEPSDGPQRDEQGRFVSKQQSGVEDPAPPADKLPREEYEALRAIREENKRVKAELEAIRQQIQSPQQPQEPPAPPPSIWEDEQGWQQHFGGQVAQQAAFNAQLNMSEMLNRREKADFDTMKTRFLEMAQQNPAIVQQALADPDPWNKAYTIAKNAATMEELGATDLEALKAKLREEVKAEMQQAQPVSQPLTAPPSLTGERNVGSRTGPAWAGPKPLSELLG